MRFLLYQRPDEPHRARRRRSFESFFEGNCYSSSAYVVLTVEWTNPDGSVDIVQAPLNIKSSDGVSFDTNDTFPHEVHVKHTLLPGRGFKDAGIVMERSVDAVKFNVPFYVDPITFFMSWTWNDLGERIMDAVCPSDATERGFAMYHISSFDALEVERSELRADTVYTLLTPVFYDNIISLIMPYVIAEM